MPWRFRTKREMPEGVWIKCKSCNATLFQKDFEANLAVCSQCGWHGPIGARRRIALLTDDGSFDERWSELHPKDWLGFNDKERYPDKLKKSVARTGSLEAAVAGTAKLDGHPITLCVLDFAFMGGSMGSVVGEKVTRTIEAATEAGVPAIVVSQSGGARMHEGAVSLMQMAKTSAAIERHGRKGLLFISILTDPTTGGVTASFAALGDVIIAEPGALIGFAGPRVIQETIRATLPEGFQRSEFLLDHGFIDRIVERKDMKSELARIIGIASPSRKEA